VQRGVPVMVNQCRVRNYATGWVVTAGVIVGCLPRWDVQSVLVNGDAVPRPIFGPRRCMRPWRAVPRRAGPGASGSRLGRACRRSIPRAAALTVGGCRASPSGSPLRRLATAPAGGHVVVRPPPNLLASVQPVDDLARRVARALRLRWRIGRTRQPSGCPVDAPPRGRRVTAQCLARAVALTVRGDPVQHEGVITRAHPAGLPWLARHGATVVACRPAVGDSPHRYQDESRHLCPRTIAGQLSRRTIRLSPSSKGRLST
jgi:hypothetical protein